MVSYGHLNDESTPEQYRIIVIDGEALKAPVVEHYCLPFSGDIA